jgi:glutathione-independent formaldehyde dehydrogenase
MGQAPVKRYNVYLRDLIIAGLAKPSFIVSHHLPLESGPDAYKNFDHRADGYTKVLLKPQERPARASTERGDFSAGRSATTAAR